MSTQHGQPRSAESPYGGPVWAPLESLEALLGRWAGAHPGTVTLDVPGRSVEGRPVYAMRLTDGTVDDEDKEHALVTALHSGVERSGTATVFALVEWLLSGDPLAREVLRRQVVVCMPVANPDGYVSGRHGNVYHAWTPAGPADPDNEPGAVAVQKAMDAYQPELHADVHGLSMDFAGYIMLENSASAYSNLALRSYHREVVRLMDEAALAEGYAVDLQESDAERIFWGPELEGMEPQKLWVGRPRYYAGIYCYDHYHTLLTASEVGWERSGLVRHRRLLEVGNGIWPSEHYPGYPTRVILSNNYHMITAYGRTAAARRRSRVELWGKLGQLTIGMADPNIEGRLLCVCATSARARRQWLADTHVQPFAAKLTAHPQVDAEFIRQFVAGWPAGQNSPDALLALQAGAGAPDDDRPIENGLAIRLRIPYQKARLLDLRVNGRPLDRSETDGYLTWVARNYDYVQINIPPSTLAETDLFVVTCDYDPGETRRRWEGWKAV